MQNIKKRKELTGQMDALNASLGVYLSPDDADRHGITISTTLPVCGKLLPYKTTTTEVIYNNDSYNRL